MTLANFLSRLHCVRRRDDEADARCPAHADKTSNTLSVGVGEDDRILIYCFAAPARSQSPRGVEASR